MPRNAIVPLILMILALPLGCMGMASGGAASYAQESAPAFGYKTDSSTTLDRSAAYATDDFREYRDEAGSVAGPVAGDGLAGLDGEDGGTRGTTVPSAVEGRKLIRTGSMSVLVDDYEPFQAAPE